jgi:AcrR family transcriptional regulator
MAPVSTERSWSPVAQKRSATRPRGREQVVAAVVEAATRLFAERGPAAVPLRDVAAAANVTLSLIHRHIGNREALLREVLATEVAEAGGAPGVARTSGDVDLATFLRALFGRLEPDLRTVLQARVILDGYDLRSLQQHYPGIELGIGLLRQELPEDQARVRAALFAAFFAGWQLLGSTYLRVTGADAIPAAQLAEIISPLLDALAHAPPAAPSAETSSTRPTRPKASHQSSNAGRLNK